MDVFFRWAGIWATMVYGTVAVDYAWQAFHRCWNQRQKKRMMTDIKRMISELCPDTDAKPEEGAQ